jgi:PAS domain S-box-containing protein
MPSADLSLGPVRVLLVEDNADDAALLQRHLRRNDVIAETTRVETAEEMLKVLRGPQPPDIVLADYNLPTFSGPAALQLMKAEGLDLPFIMLSGAVSEETAVSSLRAGAHDYVSKENLSRLVPAIERELKDAASRRNRLAAEVALQASEARFHSLVEAMPLGLLISDAQGHVTYANETAKRLLEYDAIGLQTESVALTAICPELTEAVAFPVDGKLSTKPFESICMTRSGTSIESLIGLAFLNPDELPDRRLVAVFIADLTMQKKSEEVLRRTDKLAIVGRLAASIAHEINNPLEATINCLYLVAMSDLSEQARQFLEMAQKELDRVTQITVQTLKFYRASTKASQADVHELIGTVLSLLDSRIKQQRIKVSLELRADPMIFVHDGEIRQVLANLVGNALDAVPEEGRVIVRTASTREWKSDRMGIVITVADNGSGMDAATRKRIFEPFFSTKGMTGTGLGLWVSDEIATKHKGWIQLRSKVAVDGVGGTVFRFFLPGGAGGI